jgi:acylpyruvate hydrolase
VVVQTGDATRMLPYSTLGEAFVAGLLDAHDRAGAEVADPGTLDFGPVATGARKVICIGHNYRSHILEMGHELPQYPNVFSKFASTLAGPNDRLELSPCAEAWDWEAELAFVVGRRGRNIPVEHAADHIAGYTVANDVSARDWQRRSTQWLLGKTFEGTTPIGPWLVTPDEVDLEAGLEITCRVDGIEKQRANTTDLVFTPAFLVAYLSQVFTLEPGDVVLTGTPGGVGAAREPAERLQPGQTLVTTIEGIGELHNDCIEPVPHAQHGRTP